MEPMNRPNFPGSPDVPSGPGVDPVGPATGAGAPGASGIPPATTDGTPPAWNLPPAPFPVPPVLPAMSAPAPSKRRRDPLTIVMVAAAFVALGGVGFAAGRVTAPAAANAGTGGRGGGGGAFTLPGGSFAPGANNLGRIAGAVSITGTITEVTADHITLKLTNGSTITIPVDSNTAYHRQASATSTDVTTGAQVQVQLSAGANVGGGGGQQPGASGAPGVGGRAVGPASDITIVGQ